MAKVVKTKKGFRVEHSKTGKPLTGTFKSKNKAQAEARAIRKRNM